jgi:hypothetical protein
MIDTKPEATPFFTPQKIVFAVFFMVNIALLLSFPAPTAD